MFRVLGIFALEYCILTSNGYLSQNFLYNVSSIKEVHDYYYFVKWLCYGVVLFEVGIA